MQTQQQNFDIVIIGAGITGLALARSLEHLEIDIALVDAAPGNEAVANNCQADGDFSPRVSALTMASVRQLETLSVWRPFLAEHACPFRDMRVWDADGTGQVHFSAADVHQQMLGVILENHRITDALSEALDRQGNLTVLRPEKVSEINQDGVGAACSISLESGQRLQAGLLIGADGARSVVREAAGFQTREWDYGHQAIVTTVCTEYPHQFTAWQRFMPSGPLAFLPLQLAQVGESQQCYSSIVWSCTPALARELMAVSDQDFMTRLGKAFEHRLGAIEQVRPRYCFPLRQMHATDYVAEGLALVGDAAHTIHPLAGQGVNLGFQDVAVLAEVLDQAMHNGEAVSALQVLGRYQRRRKGPNLAMMALMEGFKRLFESDDLFLRWVRNTGISAVDGLPLVKRRLMSQAMGL